MAEAVRSRLTSRGSSEPPGERPVGRDLRFFGIGELAAGEELKEEYGEEGGEALEVLCGVTTGRRARRVVTTTVDVADAPDLESFEGEKKSKSVDDLDGEESMVNGKEHKEALPEQQFRNGGCASGTLHVGQSYLVIYLNCYPRYRLHNQ